MNGWKLVPIEPTEEMLSAAADAPEDWPQQHWEAMLCAAPVPPAGDVEGSVADVVMFEGGKIIDGTLAYMETAAVGDRLYSAAYVTRLTARADKNWRALIDMRDERDKVLEDLRLEKLVSAAMRQQAEDFKALSWERGQELTKARELNEHLSIALSELDSTLRVVAVAGSKTALSSLRTLAKRSLNIVHGLLSDQSAPAAKGGSDE